MLDGNRDKGQSGDFPGTPTVAIFGSDDGMLVTLNGSSGNATALSTLNPPDTRYQPNDTSALLGLSRANSNPNLAFSLLGRTTPVSCNGFAGCLALSSANDQGQTAADGRMFMPAIYVGAYQAPGVDSSWKLLTTATNSVFGCEPLNPTCGATGPWTLAKAESFRGIPGDFFVIGGNVHLLEWIPPL